MFGQSTVSKTESVRFVDRVNDPRAVQRIKPEMFYEYRDAFAYLDRRIRPAKLDPGKIEHLPLADRVFCFLKISVSGTKQCSIVSYGISGRRLMDRSTDLG